MQPSDRLQSYLFVAWHATKISASFVNSALLIRLTTIYNAGKENNAAHLTLFASALELHLGFIGVGRGLTARRLQAPKLTDPLIEKEENLNIKTKTMSPAVHLSVRRLFKEGICPLFPPVYLHFDCPS